MSTTESKQSEDYLRVPRLNAAGTNWVIYKDRLCFAADARGYLDHIKAVYPAPEAPELPEDATAAQKRDHAEAVKKHEEKLASWCKGEAVMKQLIASSIPDSLFMKIRGKPTAFEIWSALAADFEKKSRMVSVELRRRLQETRCGDKESVPAHFARLREMRETLAGMGNAPSDEDFGAIVLGSLPPSYETYVSALMAARSLMADTKTLTAEELMLTLSDEYDRLAAKRRPANTGNANGDVALSAQERGGRARFHGKSRRECYNCHKQGHIKADCWAPGGGKEGQGPKSASKPKETAAAGATAATGTSAAPGASADKVKESSDFAWVAVEAEDADEDFPDLESIADTESDIPDLETVSDSSEEAWERDLLDADWEAEFNTFLADEKGSSLFDESAGFAAQGSNAHPKETLLFDSGATRHMTPSLQADPMGDQLG